jgi:hypothetical protein
LVGELSLDTWRALWFDGPDVGRNRAGPHGFVAE